jgi:hypothetical protein
MEANALAVKKPHPNLRWFAELQPEPGTSKPWIRILRLKAGAFEDPIHGHLEVEELDAADPFDALSYCCGPDILSCSITINNIPEFRITENLWNALQRIRKTGGDRRLWVDAICINQEDVREKSSQIRNMHAVYSRAKEVCIYFGECKEQILDRINAIMEKNDASRSPRYKRRAEKLKGTSFERAWDLYHRRRRRLQGGLGGTPDMWDVFPVPFMQASLEDLFENHVYDATWQGFWWNRLGQCKRCYWRSTR